MLYACAPTLYDHDHMDIVDWRALVNACPELAAVPPELRARAALRKCAPNDVLGRAGEKPRRMFFVVEGEVRLLRRSREGAEAVLQRASGGFVAEASLDSGRYHCDIVAAGAGRVLAFPVEGFAAALRADEAFRQFWMRRMAREVRKLRAQCERLGMRNAAARVEHFIESEGKDGVLELRVPRKAWAGELGLTHEALYRTLAQMGKRGRLKLSGGDGTPLRLALQPRKAAR